jgi:hypothetical protein
MKSLVDAFVPFTCSFRSRAQSLAVMGGALLFFLLPCATAGLIQVFSSSGIDSDYFLWSQLGGDQTPIGTSAGPLVSQNGYLASVSLPGDDSILEVVCPPGAPPSAPCSYQTQTVGFDGGDTVLVTSTLDDSTGTGGNGPLTLGFSTELPSVGAWIQQDLSTGPFEAELMLFSGANMIGDFTETSDGEGDPVFLGAIASMPEITGAVFSLDSCTSEIVGGTTIPCSTADFAIDTIFVGTPEPSTLSLFACAFLGVLVTAAIRRRCGMLAIPAAALVLAFTPAFPARAQVSNRLPVEPSPGKPARRAIVKARIPSSYPGLEQALSPRAGDPKLPLWSYTQQSPLDGKTYPGTMAGSNPYLRGARPTTLNMIVVPLIIEMEDSSVTFDPTAGIPSACIFQGEPPGDPLSLVQNSPIFQNEPYIMNGQNIGDVQYIDGFQRANFWSYVSLTGSGYHNTINPAYTGSMVLQVPVEQGTTYDAATDGGCGDYALIDESWFDMQLQTMIAGLGQANPSNFVLFLTYNAFVGDQGPIVEAKPIAGDLPNGCCVLGYHSAVTPVAAHNTQTYGFAAWDQTGLFPPDVSVLAHEIGEWLDDPYIDNLVPPWGNIGQVQGSCYAFLEVGDPLTGINFPAVSRAGYTYHMQELAFFSWFYRQNPSIGAGGAYSNNGTLGTAAGNLCDTALLFTDIMGNPTGPVAAGTQFDLIGALTTVAANQQVAPVVAPTGTVTITDLSQDLTLCDNVDLAALAAPNNNASIATCGPFNTAGSPWAEGMHSLLLQYTATGSWTSTTTTLDLTITP